jgi:RNA polymerase sigma-70 factor (ECF subfamily)
MCLNEDDSLMMQIATGSINAFESLVRRYQKQAIMFCYGQLNDYQLAEDTSQEAFFRLYKSARNYQPQNNFKGFFYTIMINLCRTASKRRHNVLLTSDDLESDIALNKLMDSPSYQALESKETCLNVRSAINELPIKYREAITLRELEGFKYNEIADLLEVSVNEVKILIYRGRKQLATLLKGEVKNEL